MKIFFLFIILTNPCYAGPKKIIKFLSNHVTLEVSTGISSGFATYGTFDCRKHNGPEPCTEHYGSARGGEIARGFLTASMICLSEYGRKQDFRDWFIPSLLTLTGNTYWGIREIQTKSEIHSQFSKLEK